MENYIAPKFKSDAFNCPFCKVYASQYWYETIPYQNGSVRQKHLEWQQNPQTHNFGDMYVAQCAHCAKYSLWIDGKIFIPTGSSIPQASDDMPQKVAEFYNEASTVYALSPRSSAALLRLSLQVLLKDLGEKGENINADIGNLVQKGLPAIVQQAADTVRAIGNQAVHPGTINFDDDSVIAETLFQIINLIVRYMITEPKNVNDIFNSLPEGIRDQIKKRDNKA